MYNKTQLAKDKKSGKHPRKPKKLKKGGVITDPNGQWAHPGEITRIPSGDITMQGVPYPVLGVGADGQKQMMYPGQNYKFKGPVTEYPQKGEGGWLDTMHDGGQNWSSNYTTKYGKGGHVVKVQDRLGRIHTNHNTKQSYVPWAQNGYNFPTGRPTTKEDTLAYDNYRKRQITTDLFLQQRAEDRRHEMNLGQDAYKKMEPTPEAWFQYELERNARNQGALEYVPAPLVPKKKREGGWLEQYQDKGEYKWDPSTMKTTPQVPLPTAGTQGTTVTPPQEYERATTQYELDQEAKRLKEMQDQEAIVRKQIKQNYNPVYGKYKNSLSSKLYDEENLVGGRMDDIAKKEKIDQLTKLGVLGTVGVAGMVALPEFAPNIAQAINAGFVLNGLHSLPETYRTLANPNASTWDKFTQTSGNALDFLGAGEAAKWAAPGVRAAGNYVKPAVNAARNYATDEAYKLAQRMEPYIVKSAVPPNINTAGVSIPRSSPPPSSRPTLIGRSGEADITKQTYFASELDPKMHSLFDKLNNLHYYTNDLKSLAEEFKTDTPNFNRMRKILESNLSERFVNKIANRIDRYGTQGELPGTYEEIVDKLHRLGQRSQQEIASGNYPNIYSLNAPANYKRNLETISNYSKELPQRFNRDNILSDSQFDDLLRENLDKYPENLNAAYLHPEAMLETQGRPYQLARNSFGTTAQEMGNYQGKPLLEYVNVDDSGPSRSIAHIKGGMDKFKGYWKPLDESHPIQKYFEKPEGIPSRFVGLNSGDKATPSTSLSTNSHPVSTSLITKLHDQGLVSDVNYMGHAPLNSMGVFDKYGIPREAQSLYINKAINQLISRYPKLKGLNAYPQLVDRYDTQPRIMAPYFEAVRREDGGENWLETYND